MHLYLVRHGKAEPGADDHSRRLTEEGRNAIHAVAQHLKLSGIRVDRIEHSGLVRAVETAEIMARALHGVVTVDVRLRPLGDVELVAGQLTDRGIESLMMVGHLPFMERMASYLLVGDPGTELLHFRTATVACLSTAQGRWWLEWFLPPSLA